MSQHSFISISVMPIDTRVDSKGEVEYSNAPERQVDHTPEQVCQICYTPLTLETALAENCPGPKIPDTLEGLDLTQHAE